MRILASLLVLLSLHQAGRAEDTAKVLKEALVDLEKLLQRDPVRADAYHERGCVHFKLANFKESVRDFNKYIELRPKQKASHWQRGIALYYAGQYEEGRKQFEGYQDHDSNDVENALWCYMCMARSAGLPKARQALLKIGDDRRVPMRQIYEMYAGRLKSADVLAAAQAGKPNPEVLGRQLFYAHLYIGIHYDLEGDAGKALQHLNEATEKHRIGHYMWDVARVHRDLLKNKASARD